jgi:hypothetical protein
MFNPGSLAGQIPAGEDYLIRKIQDLERVNREMLPAVMSIFGPQLAAIEAQQAALSTAQATLTTQQATLNTAVSDIATQQATLTTQQATLTTAVADINALIGAEVVTSVANANVNGISVALSWTDYTPLTFVVPAGFTNCSIMASLSASPYVTSPGGASGAVQVRVAINGTTGAKGDSGWLVAGDQRSVSANFALTASGLVGGGSVIVKSQAIATAGSPNMDYLNLSAIAVFTR